MNRRVLLLKMSNSFYNLIYLFAGGLILTIPTGPFPTFALEGSQVSADFAPLREHLIADGIPAATVDRYFDDLRFELIPELLKVNVRQPDAKAAYEGFVSPQSVKLTADYLKKHRTVFEFVLNGTRVDPEIVAAILRVESSLGEYKGKHPVMNVFASLTLLDSDQLERIAPEFWSHVLEDAEPEEEITLRKKATKRAKSKAGWAYKELKILLKMADEGKIDPLAAKGSWAGALGLPQFLPSSMEAYAKDGNEDGQIDLWTLEDAIASIANYLSLHGYRSDNPAKRRKAVWHYNHSDEYVDCILKLAEKVGGRQ